MSRPLPCTSSWQVMTALHIHREEKLEKYLCYPPDTFAISLGNLGPPAAQSATMNHIYRYHYYFKLHHSPNLLSILNGQLAVLDAHLQLLSTITLLVSTFCATLVRLACHGPRLDTKLAYTNPKVHINHAPFSFAYHLTSPSFCALSDVEGLPTSHQWEQQEQREHHSSPFVEMMLVLKRQVPQEAERQEVP